MDPVTAGRLSRALSSSRPTDVELNQPGRALARGLLWSSVAVAVGLYPLGAICLLLSTVDALNYVFANLAGLFLSGILSMLILSLAFVVVVFGALFLPTGRVPPPPIKG